MQLPLELEEWIYKHRITVSAGSASFVATVIGFPLDSIKSRLQVSKYAGVVDCVKKTYKHEGFQGFFRGLTMPLLTITLVRTVSFTIYSETKKYIADPSTVWLNPDTLKGKASLGFIGGATSGLLLSTGTCAFELVKVRSQLEYLISKKRGVPYAPQGTISGALLVYRENGFRGLYFGYSLHTLRDTLGTSLYFTSYDSLRYLLDEKRNNFGIPPTLIPFICGSTCGIGSWFLVYPIDLVKTRVQRDALSGVENRPSAREIFRRLRKGGIARLYKGLGVSAGRSALTHGSLWLMLESFRSRIEQRHALLPKEGDAVRRSSYAAARQLYQDKLDFFRSYVSSAAQAVLAKGNSVPGLPGYQLGEKKHDYDGHSIWSLHDGVKRDDSTPVSVFIFDSTPSPSTGGRDRRSLLPLARNALRKLRSLRHPDVLRFVDGHDTDSAVYIVTEAVTPLTARIGTEGQQPGQGEEWKVWGLSRIVSALRFINTSGSSTHGNLRPSSIFTSPSGEWKLGGFEVLSTAKDSTPVLYSQGGLLPDSGRFSSPEVRKSGWDVLKDLDPSALDSYQLYLLIYILFNGPLPSSFISDPSPSLPTTKGGIPQSMFPSHRRLGNPNPRARLKIDAFWEIGMGNEGGTGQQGAGFFRSNRLVKLAEGLEGFALASEGERAALVRTIKDASESLPPEFVMYKVLPSLVKAFEFGPGGPALLPLILTLGNTLPQADYTSSIVQPLIRMFATPDRAMRMALLEGLPSYADKLDQKIVTDKIWPNLVTGFADVVPLIREATVKSILLIAPKLSDRILNNDLLRYLAKTQTDTEAGIRTNTCILLGRLSKHLQPATARKVLVPAFARALRDPFVHARIAGLMSLMATVDVYEKEDLAGRVIPAMSICLVDKEKTVRLQAFKAIDMFIKRTEQLTANMPDTILPPDEQQQQGTHLSPNTSVAGSKGQPGLAESAGGAAVALAGWAFTSLSSRIANSELATPMLERRASTPSGVNLQSQNQSLSGLGTTPRADNMLAQSTSSLQGQQRSASQPNLPGISNGSNMTGPSRAASPRASLAFSSGSLDDILDSDPMAGSGDWGGDLIDVAADEGDFDEFESALPAAPAPPAEPVSYPRYTITRPAASSSPSSTSSKVKNQSLSNGRKKTVSSLGSASGSRTRATGVSKAAASVLKEIEAEEGIVAGDWAFDGDAQDDTANNDEWGAEEGRNENNRGSSASMSAAGISGPAIVASSSTTATSTPSASAIAKDKIAQMKEERKARLAAAKEKRAASVLGAKKL